MCIMSLEVSFEEQETVLNVCGTCSVIMNAVPRSGLQSGGELANSAW